MPKPTEAATEWISKQEAAVLLDVNVRQIEKRVLAGYISKRYQPRLRGQGTARVEVLRADVLALIDGTHPKLSEPMPKLASRDANIDGPQSISDRPARALEALEALERYVARQTPRMQALALATADPVSPERLGHLQDLEATALATKSLAARAWLTLPEAAEYSGLPEDTLWTIVMGGGIDAVDRHGNPASATAPQRRHVRVRRASLDTWGAQV